MQQYLLSEKQIDPFYVEFYLSTAKPDVVDALTTETVRTFREQGLQTAILTESSEEGWRVSCIAIALEQVNSNGSFAGEALAPEHVSGLHP